MRRPLVVLLLILLALVAVAKKRIPDDLRDVYDNEEDEEFRNWGKEKPKAQKRSKMEPSVKELGKSGFAGVQAMQVKLKKGSMRNMEDVRMLGTKWTSMLRTGGITDGVYAIDEDTLVVQLQDASETLLAVKKFLYSDDNVESLEIKGVMLEPDRDDDDDDDDDDEELENVKPVAWAKAPAGSGVQTKRGQGSGAAPAGGKGAGGAGKGSAGAPKKGGAKKEEKKEDL